MDDLISGEEIATLDEHGPGALQPKQVPGPKEMSKAERERHFAAGHLPYDPRCEVCSSCKKANSPHVKGHEAERTIPLLVGDYGFVKDGSDDENVTVSVLELFPYKLFFACVVPSKGSDPLVVARLCRFIQECGLLHFAYRSDREPAIVSLIQDASAMLGEMVSRSMLSRTRLLILRSTRREWQFQSIAILASLNPMDWLRGP